MIQRTHFLVTIRSRLKRFPVVSKTPIAPQGTSREMDSGRMELARLDAPGLVGLFHLMPNSILTGLTAAQLRKAAALRGRIDALERQLAGLLGGATPTRAATQPKTSRKRVRRRMSAAAKAKMSAAAKRRWKAAKAAGKKTL